MEAFEVCALLMPNEAIAYKIVAVIVGIIDKKGNLVSFAEAEGLRKGKPVVAIVFYFAARCLRAVA